MKYHDTQLIDNPGHGGDVTRQTQVGATTELLVRLLVAPYTVSLNQVLAVLAFDVFGFPTVNSPVPPAQSQASGGSGVSGSSDPNAKIGPAGVGAAHYVSVDTPLSYRVDFENESSATAPAQQVEIVDQLDSDLDWTTFELAGVGFLPLGDGIGRGMGYLTYVVRPKAGPPTGAEIRNVANITFDSGQTVATNQVDPHDPSKGTDPAKESLNTIDVNMTDLGSVAFQGLDDVATGSRWYFLRTTHSGLLTLEAVFTGAADSVRVALYAENGTLLANSSPLNGKQRIDRQVGAGEAYRLQVTGATVTSISARPISSGRTGPP